MAITPEGTVYCLRVTDVSKTDKGVFVSLEFGKISYTSGIPEIATKLDKTYPFLLKQTRETVEKEIGVHPYGAIVKKATDTFPPTSAKLRVIPCGNVSHLPPDLMITFKTNGYIETDDQIAPSMCEVGDIFTIGASEGT